LIYKNSILVLLLAFVVSCSNDLKEVQMINADKETPDESMEGVTMLYTDNGKERALLKTPLIYTYGVRQDRTVFPKGLSVDFYNVKGEKESFVRSNTGVLNNLNHFLELKDSVIMINYKTKDTLSTDYMIWKQDSAIIVAPGQSRIYGETGRFRGNNFRANQNFTKSSWKNFKGEYFYNQTDSL